MAIVDKGTQLNAFHAVENKCSIFCLQCIGGGGRNMGSMVFTCQEATPASCMSLVGRELPNELYVGSDEMNAD